MRTVSGEWLAGFTDGEGCFAIGRNGRGYKCSFHIKLRADDLPLLECIRETLVFGRIQHVPRTSETRHPQAHFIIDT
jgi:hypothetical protein